MAEDLMVVLKRNEHSGFGFSLLGTTGPPHVIYDIVEHSPAAECGEVEAGDIILKVNGTDVHRYTTKEVLKCLRLSNDPVTLELKRDPNIKAYIKEYLARTSSDLHSADVEPFNLNIYDIKSTTGGTSRKNESNQQTNILGKSPPSINFSSPNTSPRLLNSPTNSDTLCRPSRIPTAVKISPQKNVQQSPQHKKSKPSQIPTKASLVVSSNGVECSSSGNFIIGNSCSNSYQQQNQEEQTLQSTSAPPLGKARFEAYMMTGDLILNLSRTPQNSNLIATHAKKVDSLRDSPSRQSKEQKPNGALAPRASGESTPSSSSPTNSENLDSVKYINKKKDKTKKDCTINSCSNNSSNNSRSSKTNSSSSSSSSNSSSNGNSDKIDKLSERSYENGDENDEGEYKAGSHDDYKKNEHKKTKKNLISVNLYDDKSACVTSSCSSVLLNKKDNSDSTVLTKSERNNSVSCFQKSDLHRYHTSSSSSSTIKSEAISSPEETSFSVPTSPISQTTPLIDTKDSANSLPTSPEQSSSVPPEVVVRRQHHNGVVRKCDSAGFRTSKSEDHLQQAHRDGIGAIIPIDIDEDVNSSLNTLLDTRQDSEDSQSSIRDRIVWTYNAPIPQQPNATISPNSHSSSISTSPQHTTDSPQSPTSVSSSVMSSNSGSKGALVAGATSYSVVGGINYPISCGGTTGLLSCPTNNGDQSVSEAISNISSPDYQDDDNLLSSKDLLGLSLSDPSDSDSTILVSEAMQKKQQRELGAVSSAAGTIEQQRDHKIIIQVKGNTNSNNENNSLRYNRVGYSELKDPNHELHHNLTEDQLTMFCAGGSLIQQDTKESSPPVSDDGSDVDSLHSYHYSPKAVDIPSAIRLAKRLYSLDGFKKSDVSRHLSKNNDFSRAVADEYLKYFIFEEKTLDQSLREFLQQFALSGETQERERVLVHFSKRYLDCNPGSFNSQDAVHTLTCAIMLLNTDLHGQNIGRKMTCTEFVDNLADLNDGENFPKDVLKFLYQAIKSHPLEWALDEDSTEQKQRNENSIGIGGPIGSNPFLDAPQPAAAIEYKKGYVMRKSCYETNYKKSLCDFILAPFGKRSWKMYYCTLRDLVLYLHKDEHGFRKSQMSDNLHNAIRIHHALATKATDYTKKLHVFRLQTSDQSEFLFQTSDSKELQSWIDTINFVCASFSAPPLEGGVGSQKRFQRPLLPSTHTKLLMQEQLRSHEEQVLQLENSLTEHKRGPSPNKGLPLQNFKEKENYLQYELKRYKTYVSILNAKILADQQMELLNAEELFTIQRNAMISGVGGVGGAMGEGIPINNILQQQIPEVVQTQQHQQGGGNRINDIE